MLKMRSVRITHALPSLPHRRTPVLVLRLHPCTIAQRLAISKNKSPSRENSDVSSGSVRFPTTMDLQMITYTGALFEAGHGLRLVYRIFGHLAIRRPFAAGNRQEPGA